MNTTVKDVMTTRVIWVKKDATFREMAAALREHRVSAFPVVDDDRKVIGVVSEADMLNKEALIDEPGVISGILHHRDQVKARGVTAGDLMTTAVVAVRPEDTVEHAAKLMYDREVKRLPVTDESGRLVGIISRADVLSVFDRTDAAICHEITQRRAPRRVHGGPAGLPGDRDGRHRDAGRPAGDQRDRPRDRAAGPARPGRGGGPRPPQLPARGACSGRYDVLANFPMD